MIYCDKENACNMIIHYPNYRNYSMTPVYRPPLAVPLYEMANDSSKNSKCLSPLAISFIIPLIAMADKMFAAQGVTRNLNTYGS